MKWVRRGGLLAKLKGRCCSLAGLWALNLLSFPAAHLRAHKKAGVDAGLIKCMGLRNNRTLTLAAPIHASKTSKGKE